MSCNVQHLKSGDANHVFAIVPTTQQKSAWKKRIDAREREEIDQLSYFEKITNFELVTKKKKKINPAIVKMLRNWKGRMKARLRPEIDQLCFFDKITSELEIETKRSTEYGPNIEMMLKKWIEGTLGESLGDDFYAALKSGVKLCQYVSVFIPTFVNCDTSTFPIRKRL